MSHRTVVARIIGPARAPARASVPVRSVASASSKAGVKSRRSTAREGSAS